MEPKLTFHRKPMPILLYLPRNDTQVHCSLSAVLAQVLFIPVHHPPLVVEREHAAWMSIPTNGPLFLLYPRVS